MGRPSKLTEKQWTTIATRMAEGESIRSLAREFGIAEASIRARLSAQTEQVKTVAKQIVATEIALKSLPVSAQINAHNLADQLRAVSEHLAGAARYGAATAHRLSGIAHGKVAEIDDAMPLNAESVESLKGIAVLTKMANDAAEIPLNLLKANKDTIDDLNKDAMAKDGIAALMAEINGTSLPVEQ